MANTFNSKTKTWRIDTTGVITADKVYVKQVRLAISGGTAAVIIANADDVNKIIWESKASVENPAGDLIEQWWDNGFRVTTLTNAVLYVDLA